MEIKILGVDCAACEHMRDLVLTALDILIFQDVQIEVVTDPEEISLWLEGKPSPGLVLNGKLVFAGPSPTLEDVIELLEYARTD